MSKNRKKAYLGLMVIGGAALFIDRFLLVKSVSEPSAAVALPAVEQASRLGTAPSPSGSTALSIPEIPFPRDLPDFDDDASGEPIRDFFAPPRSTLQEEAEQAATDKESRDRAAHRGLASAAMFMTQHRLEGILVHQRLRIAVVDGISLAPGQSLDGCTLVYVSDNEVRFECHDGLAVLKMTDTGAAMRD